MKRLSFSTTLLTVALLLFAAAWTLVWFLLSGIEYEKAQILDLSTKVAEVTQKDDQLSKTRALIRDTANKRAALDEFLVDDASVPQFFSVLEGLGADTHTEVVIKNVAVVPAQEKNSAFERLHFELLATGAYAPLMHVVEMVEALPNDAVIDQLLMEKTGDESIDWRMVISGSIVKKKK